MKFVLSSLFTLLSVLAIGQIEGDSCSNAIEINSFPFITVDSNHLRNDVYEVGTNSGGCNLYYLNGKDVVYKLNTVEDTTLIDITLNALDDWSGVYLFNGCPDQGDCIDFSGGISTGAYTLKGNILEPNTEYYIVVSAWSEEIIYELLVSSPGASTLPDTLINCGIQNFATADAYDAPLACMDTTYCGYVDGTFGVNNVSGNLQSVFGGGVIDGNSFLKFTADNINTEILIQIDSVDGTQGPQFQILETEDFITWNSVGGALINYSEAWTKYTLNVIGLEPGKSYYLMIDPYAGKYSEYKIKFGQGVALSDSTIQQPIEILNSDTSICLREDSFRITAFSESGNYYWNTGDTTSFIETNDTGTYFVYSHEYQNECTSSDAIKVSNRAAIAPLVLDAPELKCEASIDTLRIDFDGQTVPTFFELIYPDASIDTFETVGNFSYNIILENDGKHYVRYAGRSTCAYNLFTDSVEISDYTPVEIIENGDTVCYDEIMVLETNYNEGQFSWNDGEEELNLFLIDLETDPHFVHVMHTSALNNQCSSYDTLDIIIDTLTVEVQDHLICLGTGNGAAIKLASGFKPWSITFYDEDGAVERITTSNDYAEFTGNNATGSFYLARAFDGYCSEFYDQTPENTVDIEYCTDIDEYTSSTSIYPIPASEFIQVDRNDVQNISIINTLGMEVKRVQNTNIIYVSELPIGTYVLKMETNSGYSAIKTIQILR